MSAAGAPGQTAEGFVRCPYCRIEVQVSPGRPRCSLCRRRFLLGTDGVAQKMPEKDRDRFGFLSSLTAGLLIFPIMVGLAGLAVERPSLWMANCLMGPALMIMGAVVLYRDRAGTARLVGIGAILLGLAGLALGWIGFFDSFGELLFGDFGA